MCDLLRRLRNIRIVHIDRGTYMHFTCDSLLFVSCVPSRIAIFIMIFQRQTSHIYQAKEKKSEKWSKIESKDWNDDNKYL